MNNRQNTFIGNSNHYENPNGNYNYQRSYNENYPQTLTEIRQNNRQYRQGPGMRQQENQAPNVNACLYCNRGRWYDHSKCNGNQLRNKNQQTNMVQINEMPIEKN